MRHVLVLVLVGYRSDVLSLQILLTVVLLLPQSQELLLLLVSQPLQTLVFLCVA